MTALIGPAPGVPSVTSLTFGATGWVLGAWKPLSDYTSAQISCHGLFSTPAGCFVPSPCAVSLAKCSADQSEAISGEFLQLQATVQAVCKESQPSLAILLGTNSTIEFCTNTFDQLCINSYLAYTRSAVACSDIKPMSTACTVNRLERGITCGCR